MADADNLETTSGAVDDYITWRTNAPLLYDLVVHVDLDWPALSVCWLPDVPEEGARLAIGTQTDGSVDNPHEVIVAELNCSVDEELLIPHSKFQGEGGIAGLVAANDTAPWRTQTETEFGSLSFFGCTPSGACNLLRPVTRLRTPTEVNKMAASTLRKRLLATKMATGSVLLFDLTREDRPVDEVAPDLSLFSTCESDGFALEWSPMRESLIASGDNDGRLSVWDIGAGTDLESLGGLKPMQDYEALKGALCDLSFSFFDAEILCTVGDDHNCNLWDLRVSSKPQSSFSASNDELFTCAFSPHERHLIASSGKDRQVNIWDLRQLSEPLHALKGHDDSVVVVRWAPFRAECLASCSADSRCIIWDLERKEQAPEEPEDVQNGLPDASPELLFCHRGHAGGISDFSFGADDFLMCSVAEDNTLQIWQPNSCIYLSDSEGEDEPSASASPEEQLPKASDAPEVAVVVSLPTTSAENAILQEDARSEQEVSLAKRARTE